MKVSLYNIGKTVGEDGNLLGNIVFEILGESDSDYSFFRGLERKQKDLNISVAIDGGCLRIWEKKDKKEK